MISVGRVLGMSSAGNISPIKGVPMVYMTAVFDCLESKTKKRCIAEVGMVVYLNEPIMVIDSRDFRFSKRAHDRAQTYVRDFLEKGCWCGPR